MPQIHELLNDPVVAAALAHAWSESRPGTADAHEEGGFIARNVAAKRKVIRWSKGARNSIIVPSHPGCRIHGMEILATFHTHPNTGRDYLQEPSETDKRAVRDDPDLKGNLYQG